VELSDESEKFTQLGNCVCYWFLLTTEAAKDTDEQTKKKYAAQATHVQTVTRRVLLNSFRMKSSRLKGHEQYHAASEYAARSKAPSSNLFDLYPPAALDHCMESLPEPCKTCCKNDYGPVNGRSVEQAAKEENRTPNVIKNIRRKYRTLLKECLLAKRLGTSEGEGGVA